MVGNPESGPWDHLGFGVLLIRLRKEKNILLKTPDTNRGIDFLASTTSSLSLQIYHSLQVVKFENLSSKILLKDSQIRAKKIQEHPALLQFLVVLADSQLQYFSFEFNMNSIKIKEFAMNYYFLFRR